MTTKDQDFNTQEISDSKLTFHPKDKQEKCHQEDCEHVKAKEYTDYVVDKNSLYFWKCIKCGKEGNNYTQVSKK